MVKRSILIRLLPLLLTTGVACDDGGKKKADDGKAAKADAKKGAKSDAKTDAKADAKAADDGKADAKADDGAADGDAKAEAGDDAAKAEGGDAADGGSGGEAKAEGGDAKAEGGDAKAEGGDDGAKAGDGGGDDGGAKAGGDDGGKKPEKKDDGKKPEKKDDGKKPDNSAVASIDAKTLFNKKCKTCHNTNGDAKTKLGEKHDIADWTEKGWKGKWPKSKVVKIITDGKSGTKMKAFKGKLTSDEIEALAIYSRKLGK